MDAFKIAIVELQKSGSKALPHLLKDGRTSPLIANFLASNRDALRRTTDRWPAWRIFLQKALESPEETIAEAGLEWFSNLESVLLAPFCISERKVTTVCDRVFGGGRTKSVKAATWFGDERIVTGTAGGDVELSDLHTGLVLAKYHGCENTIKQVSVVSERYILSFDPDVTVWDVRKPKKPLFSGSLPLNSFEAVGVGPQAAVVWSCHQFGLLTWEDELRYTRYAQHFDPEMDLGKYERPFAINSKGLLASWEWETLWLGHVLEPSQRELLVSAPCEIERVQFCGDNRLVARFRDGSLALWTLEPGAHLIACHKGVADGFSILRSRNQIVTWSGNGALSLWDADSGNQVSRYDGLTYPVANVVNLTDEQLLIQDQYGQVFLYAVGGKRCAPIGTSDSENWLSLENGHAVGWSRGTSELELWSDEGVTVLGGHNDQVTHAISNRVGRLLSVDEGGSAIAWNLTKSIVRRNGEVRPVLGAVSITSETGAGVLWVGHQRGWVTGWELQSGREVYRFQAHSDKILGLTPVSDDRLVTWSTDRRVRVWSLEEQRGILEWRGADGTIVLNDEQVISWTVLDRDNPVFCATTWSLSTGEGLHVLQNHRSPILGALILGRDRLLTYSGSELCLWDKTSGQLLSQAEIRTELKMVYGGVSGNEFISYHRDGSLKEWRIGASDDMALRHITRVTTIHGIEIATSGLYALVWGSDELLVWSFKEGVTKQLPRPNAAVVGLLATHENVVCIATVDGVQCIELSQPSAYTWLYCGPRCIRRPMGLLGGGDYLVVGENDSAVFIDLKTGELRGLWQGESDIQVATIQFPFRGVVYTKAGHVNVLEV